MNGQLAVLNKVSVPDGANGNTPHRRYHFSPGQTLELNQAFSLNPYPSVKDRQELANRLGIDQKVCYKKFLDFGSKNLILYEKLYDKIIFIYTRI